MLLEPWGRIRVSSKDHVRPAPAAGQHRDRKRMRTFAAFALLFFTLPSASVSAAPAPPAAPPATAMEDAAPRSGFGAAVAYSEGRVFVGRPGGIDMFPMPPNRTGAVHVFTRDGDAWRQSAVVAPEDGGELGMGFGEALDAEGDLLAVGAPGEGTGHVYVFARAGDVWELQARLDWPEATPGARLGAAVATVGETVFAGAPEHDGGFGAVVVFRRQNGEWTRTSVLRGEGAASGGRFGASITGGGSVAVVGAPGGALSLLPGTPQPELLPGALFVFEEAGGAWHQETVLTPPDPGPASLGWSVAFNDEDIYGGAPLAGGFAGAIYRFSDGDDGWELVETVVPDNPVPQSGFSMSLAMSGEDMVVGTPLSGGGIGGGVAFRQNQNGRWLEVAQMGPGGPFNFYGLSVTVGDDLAIVGAPGADFFEGTGFLFARTPSGWTDAGTIVDEADGMTAVTGAEVECEQGAAGGFGCSEVDLVAFVPVQALGGDRGIIANDVWGWTDPETNIEYAIVGRADATTFVSLADPTNPVYLGELPLTEGATPNMWRDMKVYDNHAFIVSDGAGPHGVQIFDLTQLRDLPGPLPVTFEETANYDRIHSAHNIVINEESGFAYVVGASGGGETCGGGLHMIDVREPQSPAFVGCFADPTTGNAGTGYSHDAQCIRYDGPDEAFQGREICFGANENALSISDVTDKESPEAISTAAYPNTGYLHQGWVSDDHRYFYMNDEMDELAGNVSRTRTLVWDIQELGDPVLVKEHFGTTAASDHNLYVDGDLMYQANYVSGLRILDISDPTEPTEIGYFDTVPAGDDVPGFAGAWSTYPWFESGVIIVTSMREGLFVLRKRPPRVS